MKILFAGTPHNAARSLDALVNAGIEVVGVLTRPDAPVGRKQVMTPSPVADTAQLHGLPVVKSNKVDEETLAEISKLNADLGVVVAYGSFLNRAALEALPLGWVNLHYSMLPALRGAAPCRQRFNRVLQRPESRFFNLMKVWTPVKYYFRYQPKFNPVKLQGVFLAA